MFPCEKKLDCLNFSIESVFFLILHVICSAGATSLIILLHLSVWGRVGGGSLSSSFQQWDRKKPFFLTALVGLVTSSALYSKKFIFSVLAPSLPQPWQKCFSIGLADKVCYSMCECVYITVHVCDWFCVDGENGLIFFVFCVCVLVLFQCMLFWVWTAGCPLHAALLQNKTTRVLMFVFYTSSDEHIPL